VLQKNNALNPRRRRFAGFDSNDEGLYGGDAKRDPFA